MTTFGTGVDQGIKRLTLAYDQLGRLSWAGSYDSSLNLKTRSSRYYDSYGIYYYLRQDHDATDGSWNDALKYHAHYVDGASGL